MLGTLVDDLGEGLTRRHRRDVLRAMAGNLVAERTLAEVLDSAVADTADTAGAGRAAIMFSDGSDQFTVVAARSDSTLPAFAVAHAAEELIDVAWGRTRLVWSAIGRGQRTGCRGGPVHRVPRVGARAGRPA